jgi:hypothetical protein
MTSRIASFFWVALLVAGGGSVCHAQAGPDSSLPGTERLSGQITAGLGVTVIDGDLYYRLRIAPDLSLGAVGVGLDVDLLIGAEDGKIREQDWNENRDYARVVRYVSYGRSGEPFFGRLGALDAASLGHGFIMHRYDNRADENNPRVGLQIEIQHGRYRFLGMTSDLGRLGVAGGRASARPLDELRLIPPLSRFEVGAAFVGDADQDQRTSTRDGVSVYGIDVTLPLLSTGFLDAGLYADWAKIAAHGQGGAVGVQASVGRMAGLLQLEGRLEERFLGEEFVPGYFDRFYEIQRFREISPGIFVRKSESVSRKVGETTTGVYGELGGSILERVSLSGSYEYYKNWRGSGLLHLEAQAPKLLPRTDISAAYDRRGIESVSDLGDVDENTYLTAEIGHEVYPHVVLYFTYQRTYEWRPTEGRYFSVEKVSPRVDVSFSF